MSVYNGERYLREQLNSLALQTYSNWKLIVRNNGSSDATQKILEDFQLLHGSSKIQIVKNTEKPLEVYHSFAKLSDQVSDGYIMFCDGDDFWLPNKVKHAVENLQKMENQFGMDTPLLFHTDLVIVDEHLSILNPSMRKAQKLGNKKRSAIGCIMHNNGVGNTFIFNTALAKKAMKRPSKFIMHDVYYLTLATIFGQVSSSPKAHILYRQHSTNVCGGHQLGWREYYSKMDRRQIRSKLKEKYLLAGNIAHLFKGEISESLYRQLIEIGGLEKCSGLKRRYILIKNKAFMSGIFRNIGLFLFV